MIQQSLKSNKTFALILGHALQPHLCTVTSIYIYLEFCLILVPIPTSHHYFALLIFWDIRDSQSNILMTSFMPTEESGLILILFIIYLLNSITVSWFPSLFNFLKQPLLTSSCVLVDITIVVFNIPLWLQLVAMFGFISAILLCVVRTQYVRGLFQCFFLSLNQPFL